ncbi:MAG TPA: hypothetical protein VJ761_00760 [Ktedonobacteraceae bacterium]|nr:hypothetical protein [Ktedonobacteraceae bacterium]
MRTIKDIFKQQLLLGVFIVLVPALLLNTGVAQAATVAHSKSWKVVSSPNTGIADQFNGIAAISKQDVWAVGDYTNSSNVEQTLIEQWNGSSWGIVASPNVGSSDNVLYGVAAVSASDIWAVGQSGDRYTGPLQTLIEHWDGTSWSVIPGVNPGTDEGLFGVAVVSTSNVWAVGYYVNRHEQPLIEQWNGTSWSVVASPKLGADGGGFLGITAISASDIWAVGSHGINQYTQNVLIEHWNGTKWKVVSGTSPSDYNQLIGLAAVATNDVWAVGYGDFISGPTEMLIEHWDGSSWSIIDANVYNQSLYAIAAISANDIWAVGYTDNPSTLIEHWDGTSWSPVPSPAPGSYSQLFGVARVPGSKHLWAGGYYAPSNAAQTLTEFYG